jgi:hypothetical protein
MERRRSFHFTQRSFRHFELNEPVFIGAIWWEQLPNSGKLVVATRFNEPSMGLCVCAERVNPVSLQGEETSLQLNYSHDVVCTCRGEVAAPAAMMVFSLNNNCWQL